MDSPQFVSRREVLQEDGATWGGVGGWDGEIDSSSRIQVSEGAVSPSAGIYERAVHSWPMSSGTGTSADDEVGSFNGTLEGVTWTSGDYVGGHALEGAGDGGRVALGNLGGFGSVYGYQGFSFAVTLDIGALPPQQFDLLKGVGSSSARFVVEVGDGWTYGKTGHPLIVLQDPSQDTIRVRSTEDFQNQRSRLLMSYSGGSSVSALKVYKNGVDVTKHVMNQSYSGVGDFHGGVYLFGDSGALEGIVDSPVLFDGPLTPEEAMIDYRNQPWSENSV